MLTERHFASFAFPWLIFDGRHALINRGDGCLFRLPDGARSAASEEYYPRAPVGWSRCPSGYAVYVVHVPNLFDYRLVVPGLKIVGVSTIQGRSDSLNIKTTAQEMERMVSRTLTGFDQAEQFFQTVMERNVHEMRQINRDIIAANEDVSHFLDGVPDAELARVRVNNLRALSEILGSRTDFLDYLSNPASSAGKLPVRPYSKFDKTVRSLRKRAADRSVSLGHTGNSVGVIKGLPVFEVIPYLLIENAIKFSPPNHSIHVDFQERPKAIQVTVQNLGPLMTDEEIAKVFLSGFRGSAAVQNNIPGSGFGLFFLRDLVERHHSGKFRFRQFGDVMQIGSASYRWTEVLLEFPRIS